MVIISILATLIACKTKPYLTHKLQYKKISDNCMTAKGSFKMNSNINGERYEFEECLDHDFAGRNYSVDRKGDTVVVNFVQSKTKSIRSLFSITLDIDSYPRYNYITIGENTFAVVPAGG